MNRIMRISVLLIAATLLIPATLSAYRLEKSWERSFEVEEGVWFKLENVNGSINVEGWDRDRIEIAADVRIKAPSKSEAKKIFERIEFEVEESRDRVSVRALLPKRRFFSFLGFGDSRTAIKITYTVKVPYTTDLKLESVNGGISVEDVGGEFYLKTVNGHIDSRLLGGEGEIMTVNGGIECVLEEFPEDGRLYIKTVNGGVDLEIPGDTGAELDVKTLNGRARTDFDLSHVKKKKRNRIQGDIGDGNGEITVRTTNGGVRIGAR